MSDGVESPPSSEGTDDGRADTHEEAAFKRVDWEQIDRSPRWLSAELLVLVVGLVVVGALYWYDHNSGQTYLIFHWSVKNADWLVLIGLVIFAAFLLVPVARRPRRLLRLLNRMRGRWGLLVSLGILFIVGVMGIWSTLTNFQPRLALSADQTSLFRHQPPVGFSNNLAPGNGCAGEVTGESPYDLVCHGSWEYPLGTDSWGYAIHDLIIVGSMPPVYIILLVIGLIIPIATIVGLVAGIYGGVVDDLLMAYVDVQLSVPAIIIYLLIYMFILNSMFVFLVAFGLLSWGGIARLVRSEALQRREEGFVLSARALGASRPYLIRHHVLPNVTNTVVPAMFHLIAVIILTEAGLSFLGFNPMFQSWGMTIGEGVQVPMLSDPIEYWWHAGFPAVALALTVAACKVAGDGFRDILDPHQ